VVGPEHAVMRLVANNVGSRSLALNARHQLPGWAAPLVLREASRRVSGRLITISQVHEGCWSATLKTGITIWHGTTLRPHRVDDWHRPSNLVAKAKSDNSSNVRRFRAYAKAHPGESPWGVTLAGVPHLHAAIDRNRRFGLEFKYVGL